MLQGLSINELNFETPFRLNNKPRNSLHFPQKGTLTPTHAEDDTRDSCSGMWTRTRGRLCAGSLAATLPEHLRRPLLPGWPWGSDQGSGQQAGASSAGGSLMGATCLDQLMAGLPEGSELTSGIPPPLYATHKELPESGAQHHAPGTVCILAHLVLTSK